MVLGEMAENNFHRALQISDNSYRIFIDKPISLTFFIIIVAILIWTYCGDMIKARLKFQRG